MPEAGFPLTVLPGRGIQRRLTFANVGCRTRTGRGGADRRSVLVRAASVRPSSSDWADYASVPCVIAADPLAGPDRRRRTERSPPAPPTGSPAGSPRPAPCRSTAPTFPGAVLDRQPGSSRGPCRRRPGRRSVERGSARDRLGVDGDRALLVAVFGGSLGARRINHAVADAVRRLARSSRRPGPAPRQRSPRPRRADRSHRRSRRRSPLQSTTSSSTRTTCRSVYAAADVVLCRAGASSVAELTVTGVPVDPRPPAGRRPATIRPPTPGRWSTRGAAVPWSPDAELDAERVLEPRWAASLDDADRRTSDMAATPSRDLARPDAAAAVVDLIDRTRPPTPDPRTSPR